MADECKRSLDCTCKDCAASSAAFSVDDLKKITSTIAYTDAGWESVADAGPGGSSAPAFKKPAGSRKPKAKAAAAKPRPPRPARPPPAANKDAAATKWSGLDDEAAAEAETPLPEPPTGEAAPDTERAKPPGAPEDESLPTAAATVDTTELEPESAAEEESASAQHAIDAEPAMAAEAAADSEAAVDAKAALDAAAANDAGAATDGGMAAAAGQASEAAVSGGDFGGNGRVGVEADDGGAAEGGEGNETQVGGGGGDEGPLADRLVDKEWKVRRAAYDELAGVFREAAAGDRCFAEHGPLLKKMLSDSNATCLDSALDAAFEFADRAPNAGDRAASIAPVIIAKGFPGRPKAAERAQAVVMKLMEVSTPEATVSALLDGLKDKKPKVPPLCVQCILDALEAFGAPAMPVKEIRAQLPAMLVHSNNNVRSSSLKLLVQLVRWHSIAVFQAIVDELRAAQRKEFNEELEKQPEGKCRPTLYLRKDRPKEKDAAAEDGDGEADDDASPAVDMRDLVEEVDLLAKLPKTEFEAKLAEAKWNEKVEGLNIALELIGPVPKLAPGDYAALVRRLKALADHSHVQVVQNSLKLLAALAEGLRNGFSPYARSSFMLAAGKLRDKKCAAVAADCMDRIYGSPLTLDSLLEELPTLLDPKKVGVVHARAALLNWLARCMAKPPPPALDGATLVAISRMLAAPLADSDPAIKEAAEAATEAAVVASRRKGSSASATSAVWAVVQALQASNVRSFNRIKEKLDGGGGGDAGGADAAKAGGGGKPGSARFLSRPRSASSNSTGSREPAAAAAAPAKKAGPGGRTAAGTTRPGSSAGAGGAAPRGRAKPAAGKAKAGIAGAAGGGGGDEDAEGGVSLSPEEATERLAELGIPAWETEVVPGLSSAKWQERKAALDAIGAAAADAGGAFPAVVVVLSGASKGFKDSNFNVLKAALEAVTAHVSADADGVGIDRRALAAALGPACEKLGDRKLKETVMTLLTAAAEAVGPGFVCKRVLKAANEAKAPGTVAEAIVWLRSCVDDFGAGSVAVAPLATFAAAQAESSNAALRSASVDLLAAFYRALGPPVKSLMGDVKPVVKAVLDAKFDEVGFDAAAAAGAAKRQVKGVAAAAEAGSGGSGGASGLPRADLSSLLPKDCLERMADTAGRESWKGRKAAMEEVQAACERSAFYIEPNKAVGETVKALKARLADSQSNLKPIAATTLAMVSRSVGNDATVRLIRAYGETLLGCVADNKKGMRDTAVAALETIVTGGDGGVAHAPTMAALVPSLEVAMARPVGRQELLQWAVKHLPALQKADGPERLVAPLLAGLQDKSPPPRQAAEDCLAALVAAGIVSASAVRDGTRDYQPAAVRTMQPALERIAKATAAPGTNAAASAAASEAAESTTATSRASAASGAAAGPRKAAAGSAAGASKTLRRPASSLAAANGLGSTGGSAAAAAGASKDVFAASTLKRPSTGSSGPSGFHAAADDGSSGGSGCGLLRHGGKAKRVEQDRRTRWFVSSEEPRDAQMEALKAQWSPLLTPSGAAALFPATRPGGGMEGAIDGLSLLSAAAAGGSGDVEALQEHLDLVCKWLSLRLCDKENSQAMQAMVDTLLEIFAALKAASYTMQDYEAELLLPTLLDKSGQGKDRFRQGFKSLMAAAAEVYPGPKYVVMVTVGLTSKNTRTRSACTAELGRLVEVWGVRNVGQKAMKEVAKLVDAREADLRAPALDALELAFLRLDCDLAKLHRFVGPLPDKAKTLVDERMKAVSKRRGGAAVGTGAAAPAVAAAAAGAAAGAGSLPTTPSRRLEGSKTLGRAAAAGAAGGGSRIPSPSVGSPLNRTPSAGGSLRERPAASAFTGPRTATSIRGGGGGSSRGGDRDFPHRASLDTLPALGQVEDADFNLEGLCLTASVSAAGPFQFNPDDESLGLGSEEGAALGSPERRVLDYGVADGTTTAPNAGGGGGNGGKDRAAPELPHSSYTRVMAAMDALQKLPLPLAADSEERAELLGALLNLSKVFRGTSKDVSCPTACGISGVLNAVLAAGRAALQWSAPAATAGNDGSSGGGGSGSDSGVRAVGGKLLMSVALPLMELVSRHSAWLSHSDLCALLGTVAAVLADGGQQLDQAMVSAGSPGPGSPESLDGAQQQPQQPPKSMAAALDKLLRTIVEKMAAAEVISALLELLHGGYAAGNGKELRSGEIKVLAQLLITAADCKGAAFPDPEPLLMPMHNMLALERPQDLDGAASDALDGTTSLCERLFAKLCRRRGEDQVVKALAAAGVPQDSPLLELLDDEETREMARKAISDAAAAAAAEKAASAQAAAADSDAATAVAGKAASAQAAAADREHTPALGRRTSSGAGRLGFHGSPAAVPRHSDAGRRKSNSGLTPQQQARQQLARDEMRKLAERVKDEPDNEEIFDEMAKLVHECPEAGDQLRHFGASLRDSYDAAGARLLARKAGAQFGGEGASKGGPSAIEAIKAKLNQNSRQPFASNGMHPTPSAPAAAVASGAPAAASARPMTGAASNGTLLLEDIKAKLGKGNSNSSSC